ncbi:hypothetical protein HYPSUDRAFT_37723 [Hypholoma sublateritium FD-334 SS-4]|uniref:Uncharacterized protein n=1 Tax=Hypholoma sublateritium (strain FD-334 SS-4) TaxID=945553 RepID=A0A0D2P2V5_HYPSF|nr:hypothetical protein HYPSUDRAFT_37723 [Hypholoma sublateritium FD-334 SS-4]
MRNEYPDSGSPLRATVASNLALVRNHSLMKGKDTTKKPKAKIAHYRPRHKGLNHVPKQVTSHGFAERIRMQPPQDRSPGSEPVYCSVLEFQTDTTDIIEMNNDNYPEAHKVFDNWDTKDHRRRPQLPNSSLPTVTSHRYRKKSPKMRGPELSTPYPTARGLDQFEPLAPGLQSNFPGAVEYPSPYRGYPQCIEIPSLKLVAPQQYLQNGMDPEGSSANFFDVSEQNVAIDDRPAWEHGLLFNSYDQPQLQAQSLMDNHPLSFPTSTQDSPLIFNQGGDLYGVEYVDIISYGGEPLQSYSEATPLQYQETPDHSSPSQVSHLEINGNLPNPTRNPYAEDWNQLLYPSQYPPHDSFYGH